MHVHVDGAGGGAAVLARGQEEAGCGITFTISSLVLLHSSTFCGLGSEKIPRSSQSICLVAPRGSYSKFPPALARSLGQQQFLANKYDPEPVPEPRNRFSALEV